MPLIQNKFHHFVWWHYSSLECNISSLKINLSRFKICCFLTRKVFRFSVEKKNWPRCNFRNVDHPDWIWSLWNFRTAASWVSFQNSESWRGNGICQLVFWKKKVLILDRCCGSVGRAVAFDTWGLPFISHHSHQCKNFQQIYNLKNTKL